MMYCCKTLNKFIIHTLSVWTLELSHIMAWPVLNLPFTLGMFVNMLYLEFDDQLITILFSGYM